MTAPCPFCGSTACDVVRVERFGAPPADAIAAEGWWAWSVVCSCCAAEGPWAKTSADAAVQAWIQRVHLDTPRKPAV